MFVSSIPRQCAFFAGAFIIVALNSAFAGNPWNTGPKNIPEEAYEPRTVSVPAGRNPRNRFGVHGGVAFGVNAKFLSSAFTGNDITAIKEVGPESISVNSASSSTDSDKGEGGEIFYERVLGESDLQSEGVNETWGVHLAIGYNRLGAKSSSRVDSFRPLVADTPDEAKPEFLGQGTILHDLEADLWHADVGLFKESYLTDRLYTKVGGGITLAYIDSEYSIQGPFNFVDESASDQDLLVGGYLDLTVGYDITPNWSLYGGVRYQYLSSFDLSTPSSNAELEFNQTYMAFVGVRFAF